MANYYVATTGAVGGTGAYGDPFPTIQLGINAATQPGDTVIIRGGTYELDASTPGKTAPLLYQNSGTASQPIIIQNFSGEIVKIVNKDPLKPLLASNAKHHIKLVGLYLETLNYKSAYGGAYHADHTIDLGSGVWNPNQQQTTGGLDGHIVSRCVITGSIYIYGANCVVEYCEMDGKDVWTNAINDAWGCSHHNTYRYNTIHNYKNRGVWSMSYTFMNIVENNTFYSINSTDLNNIMAIDFDGAGHPVYGHRATNNIVRDVNGPGVIFECCLPYTDPNNGTVYKPIAERNYITNCDRGIHVINYGPPRNEDGEFRNTLTQCQVRYNVISKTRNSGIKCQGAPGTHIYNNVVHSSVAVNPTTYYGGIAIINSSGFFSHSCVIKNNIVSECKPRLVYIDTTTAGLVGKITMDNNCYLSTTVPGVYWLGGSGVQYTLETFRSTFGQDLHSILADPKFKDPASNYYLQGTSPCIDAGADVGLTTDYTGSTLSGVPDIGAYEYLLPEIPPPPPPIDPPPPPPPPGGGGTSGTSGAETKQSNAAYFRLGYGY